MKHENRTGNRLFFLMLCGLMTAWLVCCAAPALASTGDRTVLQADNGDGYSTAYVQDLMVEGRKIYLYMTGSVPNFRVYDMDTGETTVYDMTALQEKLRDTEAEENRTEDGDPATMDIAAWFDWNGEIYAILTRSSSRNGFSQMEGGFVRRLVLSDGQMDLEACELPRLDWSEMLEDGGDWTYSRYVSDHATVGDTLALSCFGDNGEMQLHLFNLQTGETEEREIQDLNDFTPGPDGKLLIARYKWSDTPEMLLELYDMERDEGEPFARYAVESGSIRAVAYREETDTLYFIRNGEIFAAPGRDLENAQSVNDCAIASSGVFTPLTEDGFLIVYGYEGVMLRNTDPAARGSTTIRIRPYSWSEGYNLAYYAFTESHGDIGVVQEDYGDETALLQAMMNQDDRVDIYILSSDSSVYGAVYERGFMGDLSGDEKLVEAVSQMYPMARETASRDGKLVAVPLGLSGESVAYNQKAWEDLGLTEEDVPRTWDQLLDLMETLPEKLAGTAYRAFDFYYTQEGIRGELLMQMLRNYALQHPDESFSGPALQRLTDRVARIDLETLGIFTEEEMETAESRYEELGGMKTALLSINSNPGLTIYDQDMQCLPMAFTAEEQPILPVTMVMAFMNPFSRHPAEAMAYLECLAEHLDLATEYALHEELNEPVRYPDHEEQRKSMEDWLATMKESMASGEDAPSNIRTIVEEIEKELQDFDENHWMLSPAAIRAYRDRAAYLVPARFSFWSQLYGDENGEAFSTLWAGFLKGQKTSGELLSFMDQKIRMMRLEGN